MVADIEFPERAKLRVMEKVPQYPPSMRPFKMQKRLRYMRGPEDLHTDFIHKQYGIIVSEFLFNLCILSVVAWLGKLSCHEIVIARCTTRIFTNKS